MPLMDFNACGREMARYNRWQNRVLFDLCDQIGDDARRADRGMFFGSIHATLNHILYIDQRITTLLKGGNPGAFTPTIIIADDFAELRRQREDMDAYLETLTDPENIGWQDNIRTLADVDGIVRDVPLQVLYLQIFNHQTHHRSQITSELHKMGVDYGITDVPLTPGMPF
ncbi:DinB family protein [Thalassospira sp. TSL5-1]|uniref:DinB family protein n=1 Tax=Thalassospira sp. TSL5-1 TaxID=1544451 RepID=UPI0009FA9985|nr:DinB family protein [Thalassospira sp. TSL5-1]